MPGFQMKRIVGLFFVVALVVGLTPALPSSTLCSSSTVYAAPDDGPLLRPAKPIQGGVGGKADFGVQRLERLPWDVHVLRANLHSRGPLAIAGMYLMKRHLIIVSKNGRVYCLDKRNLQPRWVTTLKSPLAKVPSEGPTHYTFLTKDSKGVNWLDAVHKRSGARGERFPVRLTFTASSGVATNASMAFVGSLGSPRNNKTIESVNLHTGRAGWGYRSTGLIYGDPVMDSSGEILAFAADDGVVTALAARASAPKGVMWERSIGGSVRGITLSPSGLVYAGNTEGNLYCIELSTGRIKWLGGAERAIKTAPYVVGGYKTISVKSDVEGASPIKKRQYVGTVFAKSVTGLHAFDALSGQPLFRDTNASRPVCHQGKYIVTVDRGRTIHFRDAMDKYKVKGSLDLGVFDLIPTNRNDGAIYAATADGTVVAAIPKLR